MVLFLFKTTLVASMSMLASLGGLQTVSAGAAFVSTSSTSSSKVVSSASRQNQMQTSLSMSETESDLYKVNIALTRELGKNDKLREHIMAHPTKTLLSDAMLVNPMELPCIEHATGPDVEKFKELVTNEDPTLSNYDYVVITSPESARVFSEFIDSSSTSLDTKLAAVGKATSKALSDLGFTVDFVPSKANGETLAQELPYADKTKLNRILYPVSAKAAGTIPEMLEARKDASFVVKRYNTYDTKSVSFNDEELDTIMNDVQIACFGSPSSVDAWIANVDRKLGNEDLSEEDKKTAEGSNGKCYAVCIGTTTARRCLESGRWHAMNIYYPKTNPGMEGWADSCFQASGDLLEQAFWA